MKSIALDFKNKTVCIMSGAQQGTEYHPTLQKSDFIEFIPEKYLEHESFTWNFEDETFTVNQEYSSVLGAIQTWKDFIPHAILPMPGLGAQFDKFLAIMGYEIIRPEELLEDLFLELLSAAFNEDSNNEEKEK